MKTITAKSYCFGNNIDTDQIYPGKYLEITDHALIASHCLEGAQERFPTDFIPGGIVTGGTNFGCGSSREHAAIAIKTIGVSAVVAKSFARIFYRNAINMGVPLVVCPDVDAVADGSDLTINFDAATITNATTGVCVSCQPISGYAMEILEAGGIKALFRKTHGVAVKSEDTL